MATMPNHGDVWLVDLAMVAKVRPCLVCSIPAKEENDRVSAMVVPHTTSTRNSRFEVACDVRILKVGAFDAQNILTIPTVQFVRRLGSLSDDQMASVERAVKLWLGLDAAS